MCQAGQAESCLSGEVRGGSEKGSTTSAYLSAEVLMSRLGKTRPEINVQGMTFFPR